MRKFNAFISMIVIITILLVPTNLVMGNKSSTIVISTAEDLIQFAENSSFDQWSKDKKVVLDSDIDLQNKEFEPIPIFSGDFDGQNHSIKGLSINKEGSNFGLFRYLEKEGVIRNLKVEGVVTPKGDRSNIGGLVGYNKGRIENATFIGHVKGKDTIGGIAGINGKGGSIVDSEVKGVIYGESKVGGLVGFNTGTITNSKNSASVNTTVEEVPIQLEDISIDIINIANLTTDSMDIGGIAGLSTGIISKSENIGSIGYLSHGYNIGGIVGRQSGYVNECINTGQVNGRKDIGGIAGQMEPYINKVIPPSKIRALQRELGPFKRNMNKMLNTIRTTSEKMNKSMKIIDEEIKKIEPHMKVLIDKIEGLIPGGQNIVGIENIEDLEYILPDLDIDDLEELFPSDDPIFDEEYEEAREGLFSSMRLIFQEFSSLTKDMGETTDILIGDMERVSESMYRMMDLLFGIIDEISSMTFNQEKIYEDVSSKDVDKYIDGKVINSINYGSIKGDISIGGIAGAMGIEFELDPEEDLKLQNNFNYDTVYQARVVIMDCENKGKIQSKKNNVGGIAGNQEMGYIKGAISENLIESIDGHYVGGIAGTSKGPIESSYVKAELEGGNYIGGIAGLAGEINNSYSMVKINKSGAYVGAIAGNIVSGSRIKDNFFVSNVLKGIDGISYQGKAEFISYNDLMNLKDLPELFKSFKLDFVLEEEIIKTMSFNYGDSFSKDVFPSIADKNGAYGRWELKDLENLVFDTKVSAQYIPYTTLLESDERRKELAIFLVEGKFKEENSIKLEKESKFSLGKDKAIESWNLEIPDDGNQGHIIRYHPPKTNKNYAIYLFENNNWKRVKTKKDGKYIVFQASGDYINIGIFEEGTSILKYSLILGIIISMVFVVLFFSKKRRKVLSIKE